MLLRSYEPEIVLPPCDYGRETVNAIGQVELDRCLPLCREESYRGRWEQLRAMVELAP